MWILENAEKQEWSKITFSMPDGNPVFWIEGNDNLSSGVTPAGNIFVTQRGSYVYNVDGSLFYRRVTFNGPLHVYCTRRNLDGA